MNARIELLSPPPTAAGPRRARLSGCCTPHVAGVDTLPPVVSGFARLIERAGALGVRFLLLLARNYPPTRL